MRKVAFTAAAGEHYVLYRLHAVGLMAALAPRNAPSVDVIVLSPDERIVAEVQVKASTGTLRGLGHPEYQGRDAGAAGPLLRPGQHP
jgi:hypothetical protein